MKKQTITPKILKALTEEQLEGVAGGDICENPQIVRHFLATRDAQGRKGFSLRNLQTLRTRAEAAKASGELEDGNWWVSNPYHDFPTREHDVFWPYLSENGLEFHADVQTFLTALTLLIEEWKLASRWRESIHR